MSCHVQETEFAGRKANLIWCTEEPDPEPQACAFCTAEGELLCDWPMMKPVPAEIKAAEVGDVWITEKNRHRARIVSIENLDSSRKPTDGEFYGRRLWILIPGHRDPYPYERGNAATYMTERPGTCDAPMCSFHSREVGDDRHYCQAHWRSWEDV